MFAGLPGGSGPNGVGVTESHFWIAVVVGLGVIGGFAKLYYSMIAEFLPQVV